jgi:hypothetical protein
LARLESFRWIENHCDHLHSFIDCTESPLKGSSHSDNQVDDPILRNSNVDLSTLNCTSNYNGSIKITRIANNPANGEVTLTVNTTFATNNTMIIPSNDYNWLAAETVFRLIAPAEVG